MPFALDPVYDEVLRFYFADTPVIGQEVWDRYTQYVEPWMQGNPTFVEFLEMYIQKPGGLEPLQEVTVIPTGVYATYLFYYFNNRSVSDRLEIWKAFLASEGYPQGTKLTPTEEELKVKELQDKFGSFVYNINSLEKQTIESLRSFASQYNAYGFDRATLALDVITAIPSGFYADYLKAFFGARTPIEPVDIWRSFLVSIGYPKKDPITSEITYQPSEEELASSAMKEAFKRHVDAIRSHEVTLAAATTASPHQIATDTILYDIMGSLRNMLNTTERLVINQANALIASGRIQQEYTSMMSRIPNLTSGPPGVITIPETASLADPTQYLNWPLENFLFGYNKINFKEVLEWGVESALARPNTEVMFEQPDGCYFKFQLVDQVAGVLPKLKVTFQYDAFSINQTQDIELYNADGRLSTEELYTAVGNAFRTLFHNNVAAVQNLANKPGLTGRFLSEGSEDEKSEDAMKRAEQNAILQQYIENIRALRDAAKTKAQILQATVSETKEKINLHTSLWTSILEMIDSIIHSIFQKK